jgi:hypothetical protein
MSAKSIDMIYFAIPEDGKGPAFGPVLDPAVAQVQADAMPGYVIGVEVMYLGFSAIDPREVPDDPA